MRSSSLVAVVFSVPSALKMVPLPSSTIVAMPSYPTLPVFVAVRVKVSSSSLTAGESFKMGTRTRMVPSVPSRATVPEV